MRLLRVSSILCALTALAVPSMATVLTFDTISNNDNIIDLPQEYGDNVTATTMGNFSYGDAGGYTPDVTVGYFGSANEDVPLTRWTTGYNDLKNVAEYEPDGNPFFGFTFDAASGHSVTLSSFDVGNYGGAITVPGITITDGAGNVLWSVSNFNLADSSVQSHVSFSPNVTAASLRMTVDVSGLGGNSDNVGFDNMLFSQGAPVPEPASFAALGLGAVGLLRRRARR